MNERKEPLVKHDNSFSIFVLRNDCNMLRFKVGSFWIKTFLLFFALFTIASGISGYAAHYYWKKYTNLQRERSELTAKLGENRRQLGRFAGIEIIQETAQPRSAMSGIVVASGDKEDIAPAAPPLETPETAGHTPQPVAPPAVAAPSLAPATVTEGTPHPAADNTSGRGGQEEELKPSTASIDDVTFRAAGPQRIRLSFDLSNKEPQFTLNGRVGLAVTTKDGDRHEITDVSRSSLRFLISRFKRVNTTFTLPDGVSPDKVKTVHILITVAEMESATFDFPFILSSS